ncbi:hypothetical protein MKX01_018767 [Papaver californicum]|nr:hypothetical protein MKX01_018767 [Papaver californicum]
MEQKRKPEEQSLKTRVPEKKGFKRTLEAGGDKEEEQKVREISSSPSPLPCSLNNQNPTVEVANQVDILNSTFSWNESHRASAKRATHVLAELAKNEEVVNIIVDGGAVMALVKHLQAPPFISDDDESAPKPFEHEVEKGSAFALGLLAVKPEHQQLIVDAGALSLLVDLLKRHTHGSNSRAVNSVIKRAADAITNLAHENSNIKTCVRLEGGIPPLVELLEFTDTRVQRAAAGALRTLAFKNEENKNQILECNALPTLILMLRSEDAAIHYEAVGVIGNLVHSSPNIKKEVLQAGALQPVIGLLSSLCSESQREAALLLGQFAATDSDCKVHIVQRGAVRPLIEMLQSPDLQLREMAAFALGRLAQDTHNQAVIAHNGGLQPLLKLLDSKNGSLQHNAAFALYCLADNEDNVFDLIKVGGIQKLQDGEFIVKATKDCVAKTLKRLEEKVHGRVHFLQNTWPLADQGDRWPGPIPRGSSKRRYEALYVSKHIFAFDGEIDEIIGQTYLFLKEQLERSTLPPPSGILHGTIIDQFIARGKSKDKAHELASQIWLAVIDNLDESEHTFVLLRSLCSGGRK